MVEVFVAQLNVQGQLMDLATKAQDRRLFESGDGRLAKGHVVRYLQLNTLKHNK